MSAVKYLAGHGYGLQQRDTEGRQALHYAVLAGHLYLAQLLIRAGQWQCRVPLPRTAAHYSRVVQGTSTSPSCSLEQVSNSAGYLYLAQLLIRAGQWQCRAPLPLPAAH